MHAYVRMLYALCTHVMWVCDGWICAYTIISTVGMKRKGCCWFVAGGCCWFHLLTCKCLSRRDKLHGRRTKYACARLAIVYDMRHNMFGGEVSQGAHQSKTNNAICILCVVPPDWFATRMTLHRTIMKATGYLYGSAPFRICLCFRDSYAMFTGFLPFAVGREHNDCMISQFFVLVVKMEW